jgi:hypothetical protein
VPVDFTGWCCGFIVWVGGTLWVFAAVARRARALQPREVLQPGLALAGPVALIVLLAVGIAIGVAYDLLTTRRP